MRVFVNILLIAILVVITPVFLLVTSLKTNVLNTAFLKHELDRHDIYALAFTVVDEEINKIELDPAIPITTAEISGLVNKVLTPEWLQENVETVLDDFNTWLNAPAGAELSMVISMGKPKATLITELDVLLDKKLAEILPCTPDMTEEEQALCNYAGLTLDDLKQEMAKSDFQLEDIINRFPDDFDLFDSNMEEIFGESEGDNQEEKTEEETEQRPEEQKLDLAAMSAQIEEQLNLSKDIYHLGLRTFWYAWIFYGVLLAAFIALNATGGWRRLVRWTGILLLCIGLVPAIIGIGSIIAQEFTLQQVQISSDLPAEVNDLLPDLVRDVRQAIFTIPLVAGIALVVLGLAGTIGAHWIPKPKDKEEK